jgi:hypothetical protein
MLITLLGLVRQYARRRREMSPAQRERVRAIRDTIEEHLRSLQGSLSPAGAVEVWTGDAEHGNVSQSIGVGPGECSSAKGEEK